MQTKSRKLRVNDAENGEHDREAPFYLNAIPALRNIHNQTQSPKHFVLIHGGCHGAWSWYKVATLLKNSGHRVTALDLGASGINPIQVEQLPLLSEFVEPLTKLMVSLPPNEKVILVAHSYGGAVISIFMERFSQKISTAVCHGYHVWSYY
ncbi:hypothetical protein DVH24_026363 [Malus domestica]|uniref:AB hydrolase-1 domain-containing protein n=1 Tax=Malus domestica TaxID=3750 RepID=A0A498KIE4_MALDO|nr:hypothetical protein DVH24_026363 [Malus domestica]